MNAAADSPNVRAIRAHIAAFSEGDIETVNLQCAEDVVWNPPLSHGIVPCNRPWTGRDGVREYCTRLIGALEWRSFEIPPVLDAPPGNVVILGKESLTVRATGKPVDNIFLANFRLRDGLTAEFLLCENTALVASAFQPGRA